MEQVLPKEDRNPLATEKTSKLILKFAIPSIISGLVNALYNIVDQIFIGQGVGVMGNAATNVAFPITTLCTALALLYGVGSCSNFSLNLGAKKKDEAAKFAGNGVFLMLVSGLALAIIINIFLNPLMKAFGASEQVLPLALTYTKITSLGIPFMIFTVGFSTLIRSDGSPTYSMFCTLIGAILNIILDPLFIFKFNMGISGAAWATVIGQFVSFIFAFSYLFRFKNMKLIKSYFIPNLNYIAKIATLGMAPCFNQLAMMLVQITMNNTLTYYGALSKYGSDIPLACVGVISKVNIIYIALVIGTSQGCQPIMGYNYGAKNYERVKKSFLQSFSVIMIISFLTFLCFQLFPRQIINIFGKGDELYYEFGIKYFRIFMFFTFLNGIQPISSFLFTSIGKAKKGVVISLTRQIIFLLPLIIIFPKFIGIDGVMYAGPIADFAAAALSIFLLVKEIKSLNNKILMEK